MNQTPITAALCLTLSCLATGQQMPGDLVVVYPKSFGSSIVSTGVDGSVNHVVTNTDSLWLSSARMPDGRHVVQNTSPQHSLVFFSADGAYLSRVDFQVQDYSSDICVFSDGIIGVLSRGEGVILINDQGQPLGNLNPAGMQNPSGCRLMPDDSLWLTDLLSWPGSSDGMVWHIDRSGVVLSSFATDFDPMDIDVAPDGTLWVAGYRGDLVHYDANGVLINRFMAQFDSQSLTLWSLAVGDDGVIWASGHYDEAIRGYDAAGSGRLHLLERGP